MNLFSIILISLLSLISGQDYELICELKDKDVGVFSSSIRTTGLENENDPTANTYSIIGNFNNDENLKNNYRGDDGKFGFKLTYTYPDGTTDELIWRQTSWCADETIVGADLSGIPDQSGKSAAAQFRGLAKSDRDETYLDGTGSEVISGNNWWYHSVGTTSLEWNNGIPGDREGSAADSSSLYVLRPAKDCSVLDIDGFLTDCSSLFDSSSSDIAQLQSDVADNAADIAGLDGRLTTAEGDISTNKGDIAGLGTRVSTNEGEITTIKGSINGLDSRLTTAEGNINTLDGRVGDSEGDINDLDTRVTAIETVINKLSAQSAGSNFIGGDEGNNGNGNGTNELPLFSAELKDMIILALLVLNMVSVCIMCSIWMRSSGSKYAKYDKVGGFEVDENIQINH